MLSSQKKDLARGITLMCSFAVVLTMMFLPIMKGSTFIHFMDHLYNSISKGSVYYIDRLNVETKGYRGKSATVSLNAETSAQADRMTLIFKKNRIPVLVGNLGIRVTTDLGIMMEAVLTDSDSMFRNRGDEIHQRYGIPEKLLLYDWWHILKATEKSLTRARQFEEAKFVHSVLTKAVECAYNYYGIEARNIMDQAYLVILSLLFYILYTIWLGFAILFLLKGFGLKLEHN